MLFVTLFKSAGGLRGPSAPTAPHPYTETERAFATLETRKNVGRVSSRSRLWDRYWGQNKRLEVILSSLTVPQGTAR